MSFGVRCKKPFTVSNKICNVLLFENESPRGGSGYHSDYLMLNNKRLQERSKSQQTDMQSVCTDRDHLRPLHLGEMPQTTTASDPGPLAIDQLSKLHKLLPTRHLDTAGR